MKKSASIGIIVVIIAVIGIYVFYQYATQEALTCAQAGELSSFDETTGEEFGECCEGLVEIGNVFYDETKTCEEIFMIVGYGSICSDCGNNNCEGWENKCNCPEDCE